MGRKKLHDWVTWTIRVPREMAQPYIEFAELSGIAPPAQVRGLIAINAPNVEADVRSLRKKFADGTLDKKIIEFMGEYIDDNGLRIVNSDSIINTIGIISIASEIYAKDTEIYDSVISAYIRMCLGIMEVVDANVTREERSDAWKSILSIAKHLSASEIRARVNGFWDMVVGVEKLASENRVESYLSMPLTDRIASAENLATSMKMALTDKMVEKFRTSVVAVPPSILKGLPQSAI